LKFYADGGHIKKGHDCFGRDGVEVMDEYGVVTYIEDGTKAAMALGDQ